MHELFAAWQELFDDLLRRFQKAGLIPQEADVCLLIDVNATRMDFRPGYRTNRTANRPGDMVIKWQLPQESRLEDGEVIFRVTVSSKQNDLRIVDTVPNMDMTIFFGPATDLTGSDRMMPNLPVFVGSVIAALEPAFS